MFLLGCRFCIRMINGSKMSQDHANEFKSDISQPEYCSKSLAYLLSHAADLIKVTSVDGCGNGRVHRWSDGSFVPI